MDDDEDDDSGAPPAFHGRVWTNPSGKEILTDDEKARFDIEGQKARRRAQLVAAGLAPTEGGNVIAMPTSGAQATGPAGVAPQSASSRVLELLISKFPEWNPQWPPEIQAKWFEAYEKLLARGAVA